MLKRYEEKVEYEYKKAKNEGDGTEFRRKKYSRWNTAPKILLGVAILAGTMFSADMAMHARVEDRSFISACESAIDYNKGIGMAFYVGKNGHTIEKIDKSDIVTKEFIEEQLGVEDGTEILNEYRNTMRDSFNSIMERYKDVEWFSGKMIDEDDRIGTVYTFKVSSEQFHYEEVEEMMKEFTLNYYYDREAGCFYYDESVLLDVSTPLGSIEMVQCTRR